MKKIMIITLVCSAIGYGCNDGRQPQMPPPQIPPSSPSPHLPPPPPPAPPQNPTNSAINAKDSEGMTALHRAVIAEDVNKVRELLTNGADVNIGNVKGDTALHLAVHTAINLEIASVLIRGGANVNAKNKAATNGGGYTPLWYAYLLSDALNRRGFIRLLQGHGGRR